MWFSGRVVNVYFLSPPFGPFGYAVPDGLSPYVKEGTAVLVPLGSREVAGVAGGDVEPEGFDYKEIIGVLGAAPYVPAAVMSAARFVAAYYACGLGEALRLAVPVSPGLSRADYYYITDRYAKDPGSFILDRSDLKVARSIKSLGWLRVSGPLEPTTLEALYGLIEGGAVAADLAAGRPNADECVLTLAVDGPSPDHVKGRHQARLLELLEASGGSTTLGELKEAGIPNSAVARTCASGLAVAYLRSGETRRTADEAGAPVLFAGGTPRTRLERVLESAGEVLARGLQALVVVPEVYQVRPVAEYLARETDVAAVEYHSSVSPSRRFSIFKKAARGTVRLIIGTRSALFLPYSGLGLVAVLDEHDSSHKQLEMAPFYNARETAVVVARAARARSVFTSAAPSAEAYLAVSEGRWAREDLARAPAAGELRFVDMDKELKKGGPSRIISEELRAHTAAALPEGLATLMLINRRGFVPYVYCDTCGFVFRCHRCDVALVYHLDERAMRCHHCGSAEPFPRYCPECHKRTLVGVGLGTEKVAEEAEKLFADARVARADSDALPTPAKAAAFWTDFEAGATDIAVGTTMVLRALASPRIGVVGVVAADTALTLPDFRTSERTFQLLVRLREEVQPGTPVVVQTFYGAHHCFTSALDGDYDAFWREELPLREGLRLPPYRRLVLVRVDGKDQDKVNARAAEAAEFIRKIPGGQDLVGAIPAPVRKVRDRFRLQLVLRTDAAWIYRNGPSLATLNRPGARGAVNVRVDVDPVEFL